MIIIFRIFFSPGKQQKVGSLRVGAAKIADGPGVLKTSISAGQLPRSNSNSSSFQIYQETENNGPSNQGQMMQKSKSQSFFNKEKNIENEKAPGKWTQNRIGKKSHAIPLDQISSKPNFQVHQDEGLVTPSKSNHHGREQFISSVR